MRGTSALSTFYGGNSILLKGVVSLASDGISTVGFMREQTEVAGVGDRISYDRGWPWVTR